MFGRKGQLSLVAMVFLYSATMLISLALFVITTMGGATVEEKIEPRVEYSLEETKTRSTFTTILNLKISKSPEVDEKYGGMKAKKIISIYFSTTGQININGNSYDRPQVKTDLETYLSHSLDKIYPDSYYEFLMKYKNQEIKVKSDGSASQKASYSVPLALSNGNSAELILRIGQGEEP